MKLLLFGGAFDPPHIGHMSLLQNAVFTWKPELVVIMPSGNPPHRGASGTPRDLRLAMCECFRPVFPNMLVSGMELERQGKSYTYDTVRELRKQHPGSDIAVAIGSDMLLSFESWHRWRDLLAEVTLVVQLRSDMELDKVRSRVNELNEQGGRVLLSSVPEPVSSSLLRSGIRAGQDLYDMIPPPADRIVRQNRLYRE